MIAGCPECHWGADEPLIVVKTFATVEAAKVWALEQQWLTTVGYDGVRKAPWLPHPQGGEHIVVGQGSVWILPETIKEVEE